MLGFCDENRQCPRGTSALRHRRVFSGVRTRSNRSQCPSTVSVARQASTCTAPRQCSAVATRRRALCDNSIQFQLSRLQPARCRSSINGCGESSVGRVCPVSATRPTTNTRVQYATQRTIATATRYSVRPIVALGDGRRGCGAAAEHRSSGQVPRCPGSHHLCTRHCAGEFLPGSTQHNPRLPWQHLA